MVSRILLFSVLTAVVVILESRESQAQSDQHRPSVLVIRHQCDELAREILQSIELRPGDRVAIRVKGAQAPVVVENAIIEELHKKQIIPLLNAPADNGLPVLDLLVLGQEVNFRPAKEGAFSRTIQTTLEGRYQSGQSQEVRFLGMFSRSQIDTVSQREVIRWSDFSMGAEEESSTFQKLLTPVILISGAFLVVYLFFTVRN